MVPLFIPIKFTYTKWAYLRLAYQLMMTVASIRFMRVYWHASLIVRMRDYGITQIVLKRKTNKQKTGWHMEGCPWPSATHWTWTYSTRIVICEQKGSKHIFHIYMSAVCDESYCFCASQNAGISGSFANCNWRVIERWYLSFGLIGMMNSLLFVSFFGHSNMFKLFLGNGKLHFMWVHIQSEWVFIHSNQRICILMSAGQEYQKLRRLNEDLPSCFQH